MKLKKFLTKNEFLNKLIFLLFGSFSFDYLFLLSLLYIFDIKIDSYRKRGNISKLDFSLILPGQFLVILKIIIFISYLNNSKREVLIIYMIKLFVRNSLRCKILILSYLKQISRIFIKFWINSFSAKRNLPAWMIVIPNRLEVFKLNVVGLFSKRRWVKSDY